MSPKQATAIMASKDPAEWKAHLESYESRLESLGKDGLQHLDSWYRGLPKVLALRDAPGHMTAEELVRIVEWKLKRGKWRPRLLQFAQAHSDQTVQAASKAAFGSIVDGKLQEGLAALTELKGIGPATASAVLAARSPERAPFMSDEALAAVFRGRAIKYNAKEYMELAKQLQEKAQELNDGQDEHLWTASDVERSLWSAAHETHSQKPAKRQASAAAKATAARSRKRKQVAS